MMRMSSLIGSSLVPVGLQVMELSKRFDGNLVKRTEKYSIAMYKIHSKIIMLMIMVFSGAFKEV